VLLFLFSSLSAIHFTAAHSEKALQLVEEKVVDCRCHVPFEAGIAVQDCTSEGAIDMRNQP
jgi:hypothetical protein